MKSAMQLNPSNDNSPWMSFKHLTLSMNVSVINKCRLISRSVIFHENVFICRLTHIQFHCGPNRKYLWLNNTSAAHSKVAYFSNTLFKKGMINDNALW